jgi:DNA-binding SARP family transcriptional activator
MTLSSCVSEPRVCLLDGFEVRLDNVRVDVSSNVERVLALLAIRERAQLRTTVSSVLWMGTTDERAAANLRTALWKARRTCGNVVVSAGSYLHLAPTVHVDLVDVLARIHRLIGPARELHPADTDIRPLTAELLTGWDEEWIVFERERLRQLRIHALESLSQRLVRLGRAGEAVEAALAAVDAEPLRESAHRTLIAAHLSEGNRYEACRQYEFYRELLLESLGEEPSESLRALFGPSTAEPGHHQQRKKGNVSV